MFSESKELNGFFQIKLIIEFYVRCFRNTNDQIFPIKLRHRISFWKNSTRKKNSQRRMQSNLLSQTSRNDFVCMRWALKNKTKITNP